MEFVAKTDVGQRRTNNEDNYFVKKYDEDLAVVIVADGLGGYESGEVASKILTDKLSANISCNITMLKKCDELEVEKFLVNTLIEINDSIYDLEKTDEKYKGMGTTIVFFLKVNEKMYYFSIGDSRMYYIDEKMKNIEQITEDDTYVNALIKTNLIDRKEADSHPKRHVLTKAVGVFKELEFKVNIFEKNKGYVILCSDGLYNMLSQERILKIINKNQFNNLADKLVESANNEGGIDNITVVVIKL